MFGAGGAARRACSANAARGRSTPPAGVSPPSDWGRVLLHLPLADLDRAIGWGMPWLSGILTHPRPDGFWKRLALTKDVGAVRLPVQHVAGHYVFFRPGTGGSI